jgi:hypothetical protein
MLLTSGHTAQHNFQNAMMVQTIIFTTLPLTPKKREKYESKRELELIIAFLHRKIIVKVVGFMGCFSAHQEISLVRDKDERSIMTS